MQNSRQWLFVSLALVLGIIIGFLLSGGLPGRYQVVTMSSGYLCLVDTTAGRIWCERSSDNWVELSPKAKK
jgi:hypothetical protein